MKNLHRKTYDWVLGWADTPYGTPALFLNALAESSFFLIAPDFLLIALSIAKPKRSFFYGLICLIGSVAGGMIGYYIGLQLMDAIGRHIINLYGLMDRFDEIGDYYKKYDAWFVGAAGFTPIPYKVFTIAAGAFKISFPVFVIASFIGRGGRFFLVSGLIYFFGAKIKIYIDKYFNLLSIIFVILLILGFIVVKLIID